MHKVELSSTSRGQEKKATDDRDKHELCLHNFFNVKCIIAGMQKVGKTTDFQFHKVLHRGEYVICIDVNE